MKLHSDNAVSTETHWTPELPRTRRTIVQAACGRFVRDPELTHRGEPPTCEVCRQRFTEFDRREI